MNILFYTAFEVSPEKGGTERITSSVAEALTKYYGYKCFSIYSIPLNSNFKCSHFEDSLLIGNLNRRSKKTELLNFINKNKIDFIVNQGDFGLCPILADIIKDLPNVKQILVHHFQPGWEVHFLRFRTMFGSIHTFKDYLRMFKKLIKYPYQKLTIVQKVKKQYRIGYEKADKVLLLSSYFISEFKEYANIDNDEKFAVIHNMLSFDQFFDIENYGQKKKEVLVVSRLNEPQKRISLAIRIWALIENDDELNKWTLKIIGHGDDESSYHKLSKKLRLKRAFFEGAQKSLPYYEQASIFMMTSRSEGWGLTLTESQQMGCVPFAFDTYSSLHDIIDDGDNGFIIPDGELHEYAQRMKKLMLDNDLRKKIAQKCIQSSHRFEQKNIGGQWNELFCSMKK